MAEQSQSGGVNNRHPSYTIGRVNEWQLMRDTMAGETAIKDGLEQYLPMPNGFKAMDDKGGAAYSAYKLRATFPEILAPSISALVGIAHGKEIKIELPDALSKVIWENADGKGMPLEAFHRSITRQLLEMGRYGVLVDAPAAGGDPFLAGYATEAIINWDDQFFVLDESENVRTGFQWELKKKYRAIDLDEQGNYRQRLYRDGSENGEEISPTGRGGKRLTHVPFVVASAVDLKPEIRTPPLIGVSRAALAIYQLDADQRHQLFMSGQETLVIVNGEAPAAVGAGVVITIEAGENQAADAKYVSPTCSGIEAHGKKIEDLRTAAVMAGARLLEQSGTVQESGEARKLRFASETATLTSILQSSCGLLEAALRDAAEMMGLNRDDVVITPPADLLDNTMRPTEAEALMRIWQEGGISYPTFYAALQKGGIASPERDDTQEYNLIKKDRDRREGLDDEEDDRGDAPPPMAE